MKSRKFPHIHSAATTDSAAQGFLLANSSAPQDDVAAATVRRFELQYNKSPRFARRRKERRQGQALLLAVLIMLLAALLSAGFLAVVSGNLNQSARVADKTRAIEASRAGIAYANAQLSGSSQGDLWRPVDVSPAPQPNDAAYNFYYSQLDKVQGWSAKRRPVLGENFPNADYPAPISNYDQALAYYRSVTYGKFPDPNQVAGDAPKFLVKVREVPSNINDPEYEADHVGEIKITSIGLSEDNPNVFNRAVAYKAGRKKSPWASALRSISNWKFGDTEDTTGVPFAGVTALAALGASPTAPAINVDVDVQTRVDNKDIPKFSKDDVPFNIVIIGKDRNNPLNSKVRGAVVTDVTVVSPTITKLKIARLEEQIAAGEVIQKAAAIGTGSTINLLNVGNVPATVPADYLNFPTQVQPNGILANGSTWLQNQIQLSNLSKAGTKLISSGSVAIDGSASTNKQVIESGDVGPTNNLDPNSNKLVPSSNVNFPGNIVLTGAAASNGVVKSDLINDGWNKIGSVKTLGLDYIANQPRTVEPFVPARIDGAQNLARYRALTRNSPIDSSGQQQGLYIDNRGDVEKVGTAPMSQQQLVNLLMSPSTAADNYTRNGTAEAENAPAKSLEEQHLRGWVGPDEFLARGALIELMPASGPNFPAPYLRVTLDARGDNTAADINRATGPVIAKSWRNSNGDIDASVYTKNFAWPTNGTIFAEGNVRVRGNITDVNNAAPRSLTIVSLNNIYIEGSVSVDARTTTDRKKLMLLAKKNVIVNPTRAVIGRTDVQTRTINNGIVTATGTPNDPMTITIPVANGLAFNKGDYVVANGEVSANDPTLKKIRGLVLTTTNNFISVSTTDTGVIRSATNAIVRSPMEAREAGTGPSAQAFYSVINTERAFNRRIPVALANTALNKLIFDHVGDLKKTDVPPTATSATIGLKIKAVDYDAVTPLPTTPTFTAELTNKQRLVVATDNVDPSSPTVSQADKMVRIYNNFNGGQRDVFNDPPADKTLSLFAADILGFAGRTDGVPLTPTGYKYQAILNENTPAPGASSIGVLPYYALAGVGLRYQPAPPADFTNNGRKAFAVDTTFPTTTPATPPDAAPNVSAVIPLATSVEFDLNSTLTSLITSTTSGDIVPYLGFNPGPNPGATDPNSGFAALEDALTVDSTFYQTKDDVIKSTIDQRVLNVPIPTNFAANSIVLKRSNKFTAPLLSNLLPDYRIRALKLENFNNGTSAIRPVAQPMQINAFVYAQEGSWLVIPGDYFRTTPAVRADVDSTGKFVGSYIDYNDNKTPDVGEYGLSNGSKYADLNRNKQSDFGENAAALRLMRYNNFQINFFGAIVENQTAVVADVPNVTPNTPPIVRGAVQDWMDKWAAYTDTVAANRGNKNQFSFINYAYDSSLADGLPGADQLRVPVTDDLLYQQ